MTGVLRSRSWAFAFLLCAGLLIANIAAQPKFASPGNWALTLATFAPFAIAAMASTPAILSGGGGIDISIGPSLTLINIIIVADLLPHGLSAPEVVIPVCLGLGALIGAVNGTLVAVFRFQPVVATLCANFILSGVATQVAGSSNPTGSTWWTDDLAGSFGPVPGALITIGVPVLIWAGLSRTAYLRNLHAVGGDDAAAFSAGVNVRAVRILAYTIGGLFAGIAGIALMAVIREGEADLATQYTLIALAAVALGGTSLSGRRGSLYGSLLGAGCIFLIENLLNEVNASALWADAIYGALLVGAVILSGVLTSTPAQSSQA
jgi:ribose transport system permease protein